MRRFVRDVVVTAIAFALLRAILFILKAVGVFEIERFWHGTVLPYVTEHSPEWIAYLVESLGGFWGGAITALTFLAIIDFIFFWRGQGQTAEPQSESELIKQYRLLLKEKRAHGETTSGPIGDTRSRREALIELDDLFSVAVKSRNRVVPPIDNFHTESERELIREWGNKVIRVLDEIEVPVSLRSRFRTLDRFQGTWTPVEGKSEEQGRCEAIWNEKIRILRLIIDAEDGYPKSN